MSAGKQILKNAGALTLARGVTAVLALVTTVYLAHVLEPDRYGVLSWGLAFLTYFGFTADLGLSVYGTREVARDTGRAVPLVGHVLMLRLGAALVAFVLYAAIVWLLPKPPLFKLVVLVQGLTLFANVIGVDWVYHGMQRLGIVALRNVVASVITLGGVLVLVRDPDDVVLAAAVTVAAVALPGVWLLVTYVREFGRPRFHIDWAVWRGILTPSLPIAASLFLIMINTNMDQLMLGVIRTDEEVGWYAAAYRLLTAALIPSQIAFQAFLPALSSALGNVEEMRARSHDYVLTLLAIGFPIAAGALLAPDLIAVFGAAYAPASTALALLLGGAVLMYASGALGGMLLAWDMQRAHMKALAVGAVANVILNFLLIPRFGIEGAAAATLASEAIVLMGMGAVHYRLTRRLYLGTIARVTLATGLGVVLPLLVARALGWPVFVAAAMAAAGYAVTAVAFRIIDLALLRKLLRNLRYRVMP